MIIYIYIAGDHIYNIVLYVSRKYRSRLPPAGLCAHLEDRALVGREGARGGAGRRAGRRRRAAAAALLAALHPQLRRRGLGGGGHLGVAAMAEMGVDLEDVGYDRDSIIL